MAASYLLLFIAAAIYPISVSAAPNYFTAMLCGHIVLLAALAASLRPVRPELTAGE
jgi:hypothetical protein